MHLTYVSSIDLKSYDIGKKQSFFISRFWANKQPDNNAPGGIDENCAEIYTGHSSINNWNDYVCSLTSNFICEKMLQ